ncbi:MAG: FIST N-terminal domain-containing protein [Rhodospirillaceae bacterium]
MKIWQKVIAHGESIEDQLWLADVSSWHLVLAFGSVERFTVPGFVDALVAAFPGAVLAGCSTAGEITGNGLQEDGCVITALRFDSARVKAAAAEVEGIAASLSAGTTLGQALAGPDLAGVLVFGCGLDINGSALIDGLVEQIGAVVQISGGLAGDGGAFKQTWTLAPTGVSDRQVIAVGFYGTSLRFGHGSFGGWEPFGPTRKITRANGNILYELDGEPALSIYKRYLGIYAEGLPASGLLYPLEMLNENCSTLGLIRTILGIDEAAGSLILAGAVCENDYLRLMHASTGALIAGAEKAAQASVGRLGRVDGAEAGTEAGRGLALLVSCVGRKLVMGDQVDDEILAVADKIGPGFTLTGFYSYGEICPMEGSTDCKLHNQTMTVTLLSEI